MATVTVVTAERTLEIEATSIVAGNVNAAGHLILTRHDGTEIDIGAVSGMQLDRGTTYSKVDAFTYVGDTDPGAVAEGSVWLDTGAIAGPFASATQQGLVELATAAETTTGTDTTRAVTPAGLKSVADTKQPSDSDLTAFAALAPANDDILQRKGGTWVNRSMAQLLADLGVSNFTGGAVTSTISRTGANWYDPVLSSKVQDDVNNKFELSADGTLRWGDGIDTPGDVSLARTGPNDLSVNSGNIRIGTTGYGLRIMEATNGKMGTTTLVGGTKLVSNTNVTANSRIFLTCQTASGTQGFLRISAKVAGSSFTITSSSTTDTSTIAWFIIEPG